MTDFRATQDGDLDMSNGLQLATDIDEAVQRLDYAVNLWIGEWFADVSAGLPWLKNPDVDLGDTNNVQYFLGDKSVYSPANITQVLTDYIESLDFINQVTSSSYVFNNESRRYEYNFEAEITSGAEITYSTFI